MAERKALKPIIINRHPALVTTMVVLLIAYALIGAFFFPALPDLLHTDTQDALIGLSLVLFGLSLPLVMLIYMALVSITVSTEGVSITHKPRHIHEELPWSGYTCMYVLTGYKQWWYLLAPSPLTKQEQLAAYRACRKSRDIPFVHGGCLLLQQYISFSHITDYIPPEIERIPEHQCATLLFGGRWQ